MRPLLTSVEQGRLIIAEALPLTSVLQDELQKFQKTIGKRGHTTMAAKTGYDDLVLSVALGVWWMDEQAK